MADPTDALPPDWRERMVDMIRGARPLDGAWFAGGPTLSPEAQIGIYRDQYRMRLYDALLVEVPGLAALLGDAVEPILRAYLDEHPSRSWTLNRVAVGLADWLEARGAPAVQVDMARLDRAVQAGFEAADGVPLRPEDLTGVPSLCLQPHVSVLRLRFDVHRFRSEALADQEAAPPRPGDFPVVVFRRGIGMRHWEVPLGAWSILGAVGEGLGVGAAIERTFAAGWLDPERLPEQISGWFQDFAERNLVGPAPR